jgi:hypothetical protein
LGHIGARDGYDRRGRALKGDDMNRTYLGIAAALTLILVAAGCSRENRTGLGPNAGAVADAGMYGDPGAVADLIRAQDATQYGRVDRMGMPAVATALIASKDAYNAADPADDVAGTFVNDLVASVGALHGALDDDLTSLGLTPCATGDCVQLAAPFIVPDRIHIDATQPSGFPNGRRLADPAIDVTLALALLDLKIHPVTTLIGVNPTENDRPFSPVFPYLASPHTAGGR